MSSGNNTACTACPAGRFLDTSSQSCQVCALGTFASSNGSAVCTTNTPGYYSSTDRTSQIACPAGTFLNGSSCSHCQPGTFTNLAGQTTCQVNPVGQVSTPQTTLSSGLQLGGIAAASFGAAENSTLTVAIATSLNVSAASVAITGIADAASGRRHLATSGQVTANFTVTCVGAAESSAAIASLNATANFSSTLARTLSTSADPLLSTLSAVSIVVSAPVSASTLYLASQPCQAGTFLNGATQSCDACAVGTVAPNTGATTCTVCPARTVWLNASVACTPCPDNAVTSPNYAAQCACAPGFFDITFGASLDGPVCSPCPLGGVCNVGFIAADEGWWRQNTASAVLYKCREGNCLAESVVGPLTPGDVGAGYSSALLAPPPLNASTAPTNCVPGNTGPLCALCLPGFAIQSGACLPCDPGSAYEDWTASQQAALIVPCILVGLLAIAFAFFQPLSPWLEGTATRLTDRTAAAAGGAKAKLVGCVTDCFTHDSHSLEMSDEKAEPHDLHVTSHGREAAPAEEVHSHALEPEAESPPPDYSLSMVRSTARLAKTTQRLSAAVKGESDSGGGSESGSEEEESFYGETGAALELFYGAQRLLDKVQKYGKILINFYQIVSTFLRSLDIPWPHVFVTVMGKVNVINLNLVHLPKAACMSPNTSYYDEFNGYTLGLLCTLVFIAIFWAVGVYVVAPISLSSMTADEIQARRAKFSSTCLQRTLMFLYLVYPGVSVAIFGMFSCTRIGAVAYLDQDVNITCYNTTWWRYVGGALVWVVVVPVGVPLFFIRLLRHFRVPDLAALVEDNAWLREAAEHSWRLGMPQPGGVDMRRLCVDTISDSHLAMLHAVLLHDAEVDAAANILAGQHVPKAAAARSEAKVTDKSNSFLKRAVRAAVALRQQVAGLLRPETKLEHLAHGDVERATRLREVLLWCRQAGVVSIGAIIWYDDLGLPEPPSKEEAHKLGAPHRTGLRSHEVPALLKRASIECGFLFSVYNSRCWYWESVELVRKLILTSILALISPGSAGQVVVGCLVALFALLANIKLKPFAERSLNFVNQMAQLTLFLFLFVALLLKVNLDGDSSATFFTSIVVFLSVLPVVLPFGLQAYIHLGGLTGDDAIDAKELAAGGSFETA